MGKTDVNLFIVNLGSLTLSESDQSTRMPVAMVGTFYKGKQKFTITRADVKAMAANLAKRGNGEIVIDYEHASEMPEVAAGGPIPAAGWITAIDPTPDANGVVWGTAKFNAPAAKMIADGEYKYGSPALDWGYRDKSNGEQQGLTLTSFALTNTPFLDRMPAIRLSDAGWTEDKGEKPNMAKEPVMCADHPKTPMLCPKCDADEIKNLNASEHTHAAPKVIRLSDVKRDATGVILVASLGDEAVSGEVVRAIDDQRTALSEVQAAINAGRITPAQRERWTRIALSDIESFRDLTKDLKQVDTSERGHGSSGAGLTAASELEQINAQLSERATAISKEQSVGFSDAYKLAAREKPDLLRRRNLLTQQAQKAAAKGGDDD